MLAIIFWFVILPLGLCFGVSILWGAPYLPVRQVDAEQLVDLTELQTGQTLMDLGSGDGRILRAAARRGIRAVGYEINPVIYTWSVVRCWPQRRLITIHLGSFWPADLTAADAITVFLMTRHMPQLDRKLQQELKKPTPVVSYVYEIPGRPVTKTTHNSFVYRYGA